MADVIVIGGGIAGLSAAAELCAHAEVTLLEQETSLGYHSTGRSAAMYTECTGSDLVRELTRASRPAFVEHDEPLTTPRAVMMVSPAAEREVLEDKFAYFQSRVTDVELVDPQTASAVCGALSVHALSGGVVEPGALELDVHGIESMYRARARAGGVSILTSEQVVDLRYEAGMWRVTTKQQQHTAPIVVNASGAWGDAVAAMAGISPLGLEPLKRSAFLFDPQRDATPWPLVYDISERWYFKPEGPNVLASAASEIPSPPIDARPDEIDIALGIERVNDVTDFNIVSVINTWAGLRTFTPDRSPAVGFEPNAEGFFWLVGQGGYGIKTAPALAALTAGLIIHGSVPVPLGEVGVTASDVSPARFRMP